MQKNLDNYIIQPAERSGSPARNLADINMISKCDEDGLTAEPSKSFELLENLARV